MTTLIAKAPFAAFGFSRALRKMIDTARDNAARRAKHIEVHNQLSAMSDRDLADIGINRSMIHEIAQAAA